MASRLNPYLTFGGRTEEAMTFYQGVFGGELSIMRFSDMPTTDGSEAPEGVMHSQLETPSGYTIMASDPPPGDTEPDRTNAAVSLSGDDADDLRGYWDKLSADGHVIEPLQTQMWGDTFGMCTDQYGVTWLVNISAPVPAEA